MKIIIVFTTFISYSFAFTLIAHKGFHNTHANEFGRCSTLYLNDLGSKHSENTIHAVREALEFGADMAEIDFRESKDGRLVVFHDERLECKTNGNGRVLDHTLKELNKLDAYYNLSFDGGKSFPLRGKGIGEIRSLDEYIRTFPNQPFHLNPKGKGKTEIEKLVKILKIMTKSARSRSVFWGSYRQYQYLKYIYPEFGVFLTNGWQTEQCFNFVKIWAPVLNWTKLPDYCLRYNNITIDLDAHFPLGMSSFTNLFHINKINLWGYNVKELHQFDLLKGLNWKGIITPHIGLLNGK